MDRVCQDQCTEHAGEALVYAITDPSSEKVFYCQDCILEMTHYSNMSNFLSIKNIINHQQNLPLQNWPPGMSKETYNILKDSSTKNKKEEIKSQISTFYKQLQSAVLNLIEDSLEAQLYSLDQMQLGGDDLIKSYNEMSKTTELKNIFVNRQKNNTEQAYRDYLKSNQDSLKDTAVKLQKRIQNQRDTEELFSVDQAELIKIIVSSLINQISFFKGDMKQPQMNANQMNNLTNEQEISEALSEIISNFRGQKDQVKNTLNEFKQQLETKRSEIQHMHQQLQQAELQLDENLASLVKDNSRILVQNDFNNSGLQKQLSQKNEVISLISNYKSLQEKEQTKAITFMRNLVYDSENQTSDGNELRIILELEKLSFNQNIQNKNNTFQTLVLCQFNQQPLQFNNTAKRHNFSDNYQQDYIFNPQPVHKNITILPDYKQGIGFEPQNTLTNQQNQIAKDINNNNDISVTKMQNFQHRLQNKDTSQNKRNNQNHFEANLNQSQIQDLNGLNKSIGDLNSLYPPTFSYNFKFAHFPPNQNQAFPPNQHEAFPPNQHEAFPTFLSQNFPPYQQQSFPTQQFAFPPPSFRNAPIEEQQQKQIEGQKQRIPFQTFGVNINFNEQQINNSENNEIQQFVPQQMNQQEYGYYQQQTHNPYLQPYRVKDNKQFMQVISFYSSNQEQQLPFNNNQVSLRNNIIMEFDDQKPFLIYSSYFIDPKKQYILRFKFLNQFQNLENLYVGVTHDFDHECNKKKLIDKICKQQIDGSNISHCEDNQKSSSSELEMRLCIQKQKLLFSYTPHYSNIYDRSSQLTKGSESSEYMRLMIYYVSKSQQNFQQQNNQQQLDEQINQTSLLQQQQQQQSTNVKIEITHFQQLKEFIDF